MRDARLAHIGYLAADLDAAVERTRAALGLPLARTLELPQFSLSAAFLGEGAGSVEVFTFTDPGLLAARLGGQTMVLDHAALLVTDIHERMAAMADAGAVFSGPDGRQIVDEPFELGGALHAWTRRGAGDQWSLQLIQLAD